LLAKLLWICYFAEVQPTVFMARKKQGVETVPDSTDSEMTNETVSPETADLDDADAPQAGKTKVRGERMTGQALLDYVESHKNDENEEVLFATGYYTIVTDKETGESETKYQRPAFFKAMTEAATGIPFAPAKRPYSARKGRAPIITVGKTGNCVVGARHSIVAGFEAGSKVQVVAEAGRIVLTQADADAVVTDDSSDESDDLDL
jgi:hypothetical protein